MEGKEVEKLIIIFEKLSKENGMVIDKIDKKTVIRAWRKVSNKLIKKTPNSPISKPTKEILIKKMNLEKEIFKEWYKAYQKLSNEQSNIQDYKSKKEEIIQSIKKSNTKSLVSNTRKSEKEIEKKVESKKINKFLKKDDKDSQKTSSQVKSIPPVKKKEIPRHALKNAMVGKEYNDKVDIDFEIVDCSIDGIDEENEHNIKFEEIGLVFDKKTLEIKGVPMKYGNYDIVIRYKIPSGEMDKRYFSLLINPDPRSLWKDLEPEDSFDFKKHEDCHIITAGDRKIIAASKRGRSHAHTAKYRDDDFKIDYLDSGWSIIAVADGAGSAELSRVGSELACNTAVSDIKEKLKVLDIDEFSNNLTMYSNNKKDDSIRLLLYKILGGAAFEARKRIQNEVDKRKIIPKKGNPEDIFATTLLLGIHRKFDAGHFIAGFWIGDGGIAVYKKNDWVKLLGTPDSGEFGGQTRFLTTPNIVTNNEELSSRIKFKLVDDFTAFFVMTDGISDPKFETDKNLLELKYWDELWKELTDPDQVNILSSKKPEKNLLQWLDFWSPGNHDDRTTAILFK